MMIVCFTLNKRYHIGSTCVGIAFHFLWSAECRTRLGYCNFGETRKIICKSASDCVYNVRRRSVFKDYALDPTVPTEGAMDGAGVLDRLGWP